MENPQLLKNKVLLITGSNASGQVVYKDSPFGFRQKFVNDFEVVTVGASPTPPNPTEVPSKEEKPQKTSGGDPPSASSPEKRSNFAPEKLVSMKKTAEIAAMFTEMKLKTPMEFALNAYSDIEDNGPHNDSGSVDFETSLGYLP